jgi:hypothetical protein
MHEKHHIHFSADLSPSPARLDSVIRATAVAAGWVSEEVV